MGKVLQLRQYGRGGWGETRGRILKAIMEGHSFKSGAMSGESDPGWRWGRLDYKYRDSVKKADYVVYSYSTPIAWHVVEGDHDYWVVPDEGYSATTSRHQGIVRTALVFAKTLPYDEDPTEQEEEE